MAEQRWQVIPLDPVARQSVNVVLGGTLVRLIVWWQPSDEHWYMTLENPLGTAVVRGERIVLDQPVTISPTAGLDGRIYCRRITGEHADPKLGAWGVTHILTWE